MCFVYYSGPTPRARTCRRSARPSFLSPCPSRRTGQTSSSRTSSSSSIPLVLLQKAFSARYLFDLILRPCFLSLQQSSNAVLIYGLFQLAGVLFTSRAVNVESFPRHTVVFVGRSRKCRDWPKHHCMGRLSTLKRHDDRSIRFAATRMNLTIVSLNHSVQCAKRELRVLFCDFWLMP